MMKSKQWGVSLSGLLVSAAILAVVALLGMKVGPEVAEYYQIVKTVKKIAGGGAETVADVRKAFDNQATIDNIKAITAQDLEISKDSGTLDVSFAYESRVHLFGNVSLLLEFQGSSGG
ncbi:MAG: DUF4845 domain-containing protein [Rhodocyclaceae bacterium]|nr:DUF4845 domain-containing protein [Rhodocyclaceae bacterium]MDZ4213342.1 DUF4845 domain-containing protein [Rhodocyclaceae bacterium]